MRIAIDLDAANSASTDWTQPGIETQVRNHCPGFVGCLENGQAVFKILGLSVNEYGRHVGHTIRKVRLYA